MAKGQNAKAEIQKKIMEMYPDAFMNDKELRIPMVDGNDNVEIKVVLTCAKENVRKPVQQEAADWSEEVPWDKPTESNLTEPTDEEKETLKKLLASF